MFSFLNDLNEAINRFFTNEVQAAVARIFWIVVGILKDIIWVIINGIKKF